MMERLKIYGMFWVVLLVALSLSGQPDPFHRIISSGDFDRSGALVNTADGGYALAGSTGAVEEDQSNMYIVKTDSNGIVQWSTVVAFTGASGANSLVEAENGDFLIAGYALIDQSRYNACIVRLDSAGDVKWRRFYGSPQNDFARRIIRASSFSSGFIVVGERGRSSGYSDAWIFQINDEGQEQINLMFGGQDDDVFTSVDVQTGFYVVGGCTKSYSQNGDRDYWVKYMNFELDEVDEIIWGTEHDDFITDVQFIGDQAEAGVAGYYNDEGTLRAAAFKAERNDSITWELNTDSLARSLRWNSLRRNGAFSAVWAGTVRDENDRLQIAFQEVETFNGIADSLIILPSDHEYDQADVTAGNLHFTFTGTYRKEGIGIDDLFLVKTGTNGEIQNADSSFFADTSFRYVLSAPEVIEDEVDPEVRIYPNPARDYLIIEHPGSENLKVMLTDLSGKTLREFRTDGGRYEADISDLSAGVYLVLTVKKKGKLRTAETTKLIIAE